MQFEDLLIARQDIIESLDVGDNFLDRDMPADPLSEVVHASFVLRVMFVVGSTPLGMLSLHCICILQKIKKISY